MPLVFDYIMESCNVGDMFSLPLLCTVIYRLVKTGLMKLIIDSVSLSHPAVNLQFSSQTILEENYI